MTTKLILGDCLEEMKKLDAGSVDAVITDPPYSINFGGGKDWDTHESPMAFQEFSKKWGAEALRILKPGGFLFSFGGTRTYHRMVCGLEDAGLKVKDQVLWVYLSGFPKAQDLGMLIEAKLGGSGEVVGEGASKSFSSNRVFGVENEGYQIKQPTLPQAKEWAGWKTASLKPAFEPVVVCQKPCEGSTTENVMKHGVGGFNIDGCRIPLQEGEDISVVRSEERKLDTNEQGWGFKAVSRNNSGRYPTNIMMGEAVFDHPDVEKDDDSINDSFSKFFIVPKPVQSEKETGLKKLEGKEMIAGAGPGGWKKKVVKNIHPTVKPTLIMEHLIKLTTTRGAVVLDPFMGSGTTGVAAYELGRSFIGIEREVEYFKIAEARVKDANKQQHLFG